MGTVQFANGDSPTADWVDIHCPFNPRVSILCLNPKADLTNGFTRATDINTPAAPQLAQAQEWDPMNGSILP